MRKILQVNFKFSKIRPQLEQAFLQAAQPVVNLTGLLAALRGEVALRRTG